MGSVRRKPSGRWEARYRDPAGCQRGQTFRTKREAELFLQRVGADVQRGEWIDPEAARMRFRRFAERWLETKVNLKESTQADYLSVLSNHLLPAFGDLPLARVDRVAVQAWVAASVKRGLGAGTIRNAYGVLRQVMGAAVEAGAISKTPCRGIDLPTVVRDEMNFVTHEEIAALAEAMAHPKDYKGRPRGNFPQFALAVQVAAYTGVRFGELAALRRKRVDLLHRRIHVAESVKEVRGRLVFGPTKTYETRTVPFPDFLAEPLARHLDGLPGDFDQLVFTARDGAPLRNSNFRRRFDAAVAQAGLPKGLRIHDLRHSFAALLIAAGGHPQAVKERMGHSTVQVTFDRYGHLFPALESSLTDALDKAARKALSESGRQASSA